MIKHFCDICGAETEQRIKISVTAKEVFGESYFKTVGDNLMDISYECCGSCYNELADIIDSAIQEEQHIQSTFDEPKNTDDVRLSIFDKLRKFIKNHKER